MIIHECLYTAVFAQGLSYSYRPGFLESKLNSVHLDCHIAKYLMFQAVFVLCFLWLICQAI